MNPTSIDTQYRIAQLEESYKQQTLAMACSLISLIDLRDRYTGGHSARVANYVRGISVQMGMEDDAEQIVLAASLHDIGKIGVPDHVLLKPGKLTDEEFEWIRKHPEWGWMAVRNVEGFHEASLLLLHHHERLDGKGYPGGLKGSAIPLGARRSRRRPGRPRAGAARGRAGQGVHPSRAPCALHVERRATPGRVRGLRRRRAANARCLQGLAQGARPLLHPGLGQQPRLQGRLRRLG